MRRPLKTLKALDNEVVTVSPRTFSGGQVLVRKQSDTFASSLSEFNTTPIQMSTAMSGSYVFKTNISIWAAGGFIWPSYFTAEFEVRHVFNGVEYSSPYVHASRSFGEIPSDYGALTSSNAYLYWGNHLNSFPIVQNLFLTAIGGVTPGPTVAFNIQNNSIGLSGDVSVDVNFTAISVSAPEDQYTLQL